VYHTEELTAFYFVKRWACSPRHWWMVSPPPHGTTAPSGPGPHYQGFLITLGRTPLDEGSAQSRDPYLTAHNTHKRQTSVPASRISNHHPRKQVTIDPRLRPRGTGIGWCIGVTSYIVLHLVLLHLGLPLLFFKHCAQMLLSWTSFRALAFEFTTITLHWMVTEHSLLALGTCWV
jgi:hypothetical protein